MSFAGLPVDGDLVIRAGGTDVEPLFVVRTIPGPDQFGCATRAKAARMARTYAEHARVNVWFVESGSAGGLTLLARFRRTARVTEGVGQAVNRPLAGSKRTG